MRPSGYLPARVGVLFIVCVLTAASSASAGQAPGGSDHAGNAMVLAGTGQGAGVGRAISAMDGAEIFSGQPFGAGFTGGVRAAVGDVNGDGVQDLILGSGPGGGLVRVVSGLDLSLLMSFSPFGGGFNGGVYVASGDIDGDGHADVIVGAGSGGQVAAFSGADTHELGRVFPFTPAYQGGVTVAAGDLDGDGHADVLAGTTNGGFVAALSGADGHVIAAGFPFGPFFVGGVSIAVGDLNGDGRADIIVAPMSAGGLVLAFSGANLDVLASFVPYPGIAGVTLAAADVDGDGRADIITGPGSGQPLVRIFSGADLHQISAFLAFDAGFGGGVFVASNSRFIVPGPPTFTSGSTASWTAGSSNVFSITTKGSPVATITLSGALPAGLSFSGGIGTA
ncbi:MAG TPA: VCBS repeat-containing protein, partial [Vicinamibacterales bacterium]|nr:VCBS repeat-containing protein [Vicinamibacterales bacterium]